MSLNVSSRCSAVKGAVYPDQTRGWGPELRSPNRDPTLQRPLRLQVPFSFGVPIPATPTSSDVGIPRLPALTAFVF